MLLARPQLLALTTCVPTALAPVQHCAPCCSPVLSRDASSAGRCHANLRRPPAFPAFPPRPLCRAAGARWSTLFTSLPPQWTGAHALRLAGSWVLAPAACSPTGQQRCSRCLPLTPLLSVPDQPMPPTPSVSRYVELTDGSYCGKAVDRSFTIDGCTFFYSPPPRAAVPFAASLRTHER
jgi:hypothetical protein